MDRGDYIKTFEGRKSIYQKEFLKEFFFSVNLLSLETKKSSSEKSNLVFQELILESMIDVKKSCFRTNVAVEFIFNVNQKNPPEIQSLLKHYVDLIQKTLPQLKTKRKYLLLKDDSQIKALSAKYWLSTTLPQGISIRIKPYSVFLNQLEFGKDLQLGKFIPKEKSKLLYNSEEGHDELFSNLEELPETSPALKLYNESVREIKRQRMLEAYSISSINDFLNVIKYPEKIKIKFQNNQKLILYNASRFVLLKDAFCIDLGTVPVEKGDTRKFKKGIRVNLNKWKNNNKNQLSNKSILALKFFYEKPEKVTHDLDNLFRIALPIFKEIMFVDRKIKEIYSFEIYQIKAIDKNLEKGKLYLKIEEFSKNNMFHIVDSLIEEFEREYNI